VVPLLRARTPTEALISRSDDSAGASAAVASSPRIASPLTHAEHAAATPAVAVEAPTGGPARHSKDSATTLMQLDAPRLPLYDRPTSSTDSDTP
jgi:hypothetical protein